MGFYRGKIIFGLIISSVGILLTLAWYNFSKPKESGNQNKKVLARLAKVTNDVSKKEAHRVIWQSLGDSDELHAGEAVRTASASEAKIVFISGAQIEMDPDSVITIEETGDKINLNFVKGNLLVKSTGGAKNGNLELKSGSTNIALNNSEVALNKGQNGQAMNVQVLQGTAVMNQGGNKVTLDKDRNGEVNASGGLNITEQFLKIKSPVAFSKVFVRTDKKEPVLFEWQPLPDGYDVYLEFGQTRENLVRMYPKVPGKSGVLATPMKLGTVFWRLVAVNAADATKSYPSAVNKLTVVAEVPPQLLFPKKDGIAALDQATKTLALRWTNPSHLEKCQVEISDDAKFSKNVYSELLEDNGHHQAPLKQEGVYYWRITGFRPGTSKEVVSDVQKFVLKTKLTLTPPELKGGVDNVRVSLDSIQSGLVNLAWEPVMGVTQYHVRVYMVNGKTLTSVFDGNVNDVNQIRFMGTKPGVYRWDVASVDGEGKFSVPSKAHTLTVDELSNMQWADPAAQSEYQYVSIKPQLKVDFKSFPGAASYKIYYKNQVGQSQEVKADSRATSKLFDVGADGFYSLTIEALNEKGLPVARSKIKDYLVKQAPLLPPPEFGPKVPGTIKARKNGLAGFIVRPVTGAKGYVVNIKKLDGKLEKSEKVVSPNIILKNLMPGDYKISVATMDVSGRTGPEGKEKNLSVPNVSESRAPTFKKVRIK